MRRYWDQIKLHFISKTPFTNFSKSEFNFFADISISLNFEEMEAKTLHIDVTPSGRPFMKIKNKRGPSTDPCGTSVFIFLQ